MRILALKSYSVHTCMQLKKTAAYFATKHDKVHKSAKAEHTTLTAAEQLFQPVTESKQAAQETDRSVQQRAYGKTILFPHG